MKPMLRFSIAVVTVGIWPESHPAEIPSFREGDFTGLG